VVADTGKERLLNDKNVLVDVQATVGVGETLVLVILTMDRTHVFDLLVKRKTGLYMGQFAIYLQNSTICPDCTTS
jgi:hypothetical protein